MKDLRNKLHRLKDDFNYNVSLIDDRDIELDRYEEQICHLKESHSKIERDKEYIVREYKKMKAQLKLVIRLLSRKSFFPRTRIKKAVYIIKITKKIIPS